MSDFPRPPRDEAEREACTGSDEMCCVSLPQQSVTDCTRPLGHAGDHISGLVGVVFARWPAAPEASTPETTAGTLTERLAEALRRLHAVAHPEPKDAPQCPYAALLAEHDASRVTPPSPAPEVRALVEEARWLVEAWRDWHGEHATERDERAAEREVYESINRLDALAAACGSTGGESGGGDA